MDYSKRTRGSRKTALAGSANFRAWCLRSPRLWFIAANLHQGEGKKKYMIADFYCLSAVCQIVSYTDFQ